jgi:hypothetical protein
MIAIEDQSERVVTAAQMPHRRRVWLWMLAPLREQIKAWAA